MWGDALRQCAGAVGARRLMRLATRLVIGLLAAVGVVLVGVVLVGQLQRGRDSAEAVGHAYAQALVGGDRAALEALVPPSFDSHFAIDEKLSRSTTIRGQRLIVTFVAHPITLNIRLAHLRGDSVSFVDEVMIQRFGDRWFLAIGQQVQPSDAPPTARPSASN